ncbi:Tricalbin-3 [Symbiodinium microadriaticum]|uniref:Tricalbin-3 n=1 Tax=Symbiodinium microadriaticum TaxID=2951 RepID=A0A1Q9F4C4_SYMMI|nr:Tricalbin-3 [Symbiodinium microadriaticum]
MAADAGKKDLSLHLEVLSARGLRDADWLPGSKGSDPFCEVTVPGKSFFFKTEVIEDTRDPVWNASTELAVSPTDVLHFAVFDMDKKKKSDRLGHVTLEVAKVLPEGFDGELQLLEASSTKWGGEKNVKAFLQLRVAVQKSVEVPGPSKDPKPVKQPEAGAISEGPQGTGREELEKLQRLRRASVESGLTIREAFLQLRVAVQKSVEVPGPSKDPKPVKQPEAGAISEGPQGTGREELEKLQRLRRASVESGLTIREVRQLSVAELERWLEEEQLRKQRRRSRRDDERGQKRVEETEDGQWWSPEEEERTEDLCSRCLAQLTPGAKFCASCGAPVDGHPEETEETIGAIQAEVPPLPLIVHEQATGKPPKPAQADELIVVHASDELPEYGASSWADTLDSPAPASYEAPAAASPSELWTERGTEEGLRPLDSDARNQRLLRLLEGPYASLPKSAAPRLDPWQKLSSFGTRPPVQIGWPGPKPSVENGRKAEDGDASEPAPGRWAVSQAAAGEVVHSSSHFGVEVFRRFLRVQKEPELHWLAEEMMHVELPQGMYPLDPMSVECKTLDRHSRCPQPPPALAFAQAFSEHAGPREEEGEVYFHHPYQEAFDHAAACQLLAKSSSDPGALLEVAEAAWTHRYGLGLSNWEENLQGGGFVHRVTGHHSRQDPRGHLLRELQLGCYLIARVRAHLGIQ